MLIACVLYILQGSCALPLWSSSLQAIPQTYHEEDIRHIPVEGPPIINVINTLSCQRSFPKKTLRSCYSREELK